MKKIPLTQGKVALVDDDDYEKLSVYKWSAYKSRYTWYAARTERIAVNKPTTVYMHRFILGVGSQHEVDHRDGNGLNNQRSNLRKATRKENGRNQRLHKNNTSGYSGIFKQNGKWRVQLTVDYAKVHIGYFSNKEDAIQAQREAAIKYFGEFAPDAFKGGSLSNYQKELG